MTLLDYSDGETFVDELPHNFETGDLCPKCGSNKTLCGFGLAGGGYGAYASCDRCGWFGKDQEPIEGSE